MKTKIRTLTNLTGKFHHYEIQILDYRYPDHKISAYLEPIGSITFQGNADETDIPAKWYARTFAINTDNPQHIAKMAKIAKFIKDNTYNRAQPEEIKLLLGAEEHFLHYSDFIPVSYIGMSFFRVKKNGNYYTRIIAPNEIAANKQFQKMKDMDSFEFDHIITNT